MNLFLREMKATRKSLVFWCIGLILMIAGGMSKYGGLTASGDALNELIAKMPKSLQAIMGTGTLDLSTPVGYYGILFTYLILMGALHAIMLGAGIIAKEERDKTTEFLMVKPISRTKIVTAKLAAALVNVVIFNLITLILSVSMVGNYSNGEEPIKNIYLLILGLFIVQLIFTVLGSAIAAVLKKPKRAASLGTAKLLFIYFLSIAIDLSGKLEGLTYMTPFKYFEAKKVLIDGALDPTFVTMSFIIIAALLAVTYVFYNKRDMDV